MAGIKIGCVRYGNSPCMDCKSRNSTCHANCEAYKEFVEQNAELNKMVRHKIDREIDNAYRIIKAKEKMVRR